MSGVGRPGRLRRQERTLLGSFGLSPVGFAIHLLVRALASAFPGHAARHNERQVPTPGGRVRGSESGSAWPQHSSHVPKRSLKGPGYLSSRGEKRRGASRRQDGAQRAGSPSLCFSPTPANPVRTWERTAEGAGTRADGVAFCQCHPTVHLVQNR